MSRVNRFSVIFSLDFSEIKKHHFSTLKTPIFGGKTRRTKHRKCLLKFAQMKIFAYLCR